MTVEALPREVPAPCEMPAVHPGVARIVVWIALGGTSWVALVGAVVGVLHLLG